VRRLERATLICITPYGTARELDANGGDGYLGNAGGCGTPHVNMGVRLAQRIGGTVGVLVVLIVNMGAGMLDRLVGVWVLVMLHNVQIKCTNSDLV
jgi:hypothetical protein